MTFWPRLRRWLLVAVFACGQLAVLAHATEHDATEAGEGTHVCLLCVAGHDLGSPVPTAANAAWLPLATGAGVQPVPLPLPRGTASSSVLARGPPHA